MGAFLVIPGENHLPFHAWSVRLTMSVIDKSRKKGNGIVEPVVSEVYDQDVSRTMVSFIFTATLVCRFPFLLIRRPRKFRKFSNWY